MEHHNEPAVNVVGILRAVGDDRLPGAVLVGAHYDHLGHGGAGSLAPDSHDIHNGADDNASGVAALLEVAKELTASEIHLRRDVYFVAFSGEEEGVLGSTAFTRKPPAGLKIGDLVAMLNMDMVGRLRDDKVSVLGAESAAEWQQIVPPVCDQEGLLCSLSEKGTAPRPQPLLRRGSARSPLLHRRSRGLSQAVGRLGQDQRRRGRPHRRLVAGIAETLAEQPGRPTYKSAPAPTPQGDTRSYGASLGTVPDYAGDGRPGVLVAGVRAGGPAEAAGIRHGDLLVELSGKEIRDIHDFMFVLQAAKPGDKSTAVVVRDGKRMTVQVTFGTSRR